MQHHWGHVQSKFGWFGSGGIGSVCSEWRMLGIAAPGATMAIMVGSKINSTSTFL